MPKYPCKDCEDRHYNCWGHCDKYLEVKKAREKKDITELYFRAPYYKTKYGWRRCSG